MEVIFSFIKQPLKVVNQTPKLIKTVYLNRTARIHPEPIIILGNPKAGRTVIAALLGKAPTYLSKMCESFGTKRSIN